MDQTNLISQNIEKSSKCMKHIKSQVVMATVSKGYSSEGLKEKMEVVGNTLNDIKPQDAIEAMIGGQIIAIHEAVMNACAYNSLASSLSSIVGENINHIAKLSKSFTSLVETLNRYRHQDKIYQNLTVGHVDVHNGGQAVVGNIASHN